MVKVAAAAGRRFMGTTTADERARVPLSRTHTLVARPRRRRRRHAISFGRAPAVVEQIREHG